MPRSIRSFTLDQDVSQWIDQEAEKAGLSRSQFLNNLASEKMERIKLAEAAVYAGLGSTALGCIFVLATILLA